MARYNNYHKHDHYGNPWTMDVVVKPVDYCKRAVELGHDSVFMMNHGVTGNIFDWLTLLDKKDKNGEKLYNLKLCCGIETYFVKNRFEKDRSNRHLVLIAKNNEGIMQLNEAMTEAHNTGHYYKPRIDSEILFSLNPKNFIVTTACVAGIWEDTELILSLHRKFGENFFLEVQSHLFDRQIEANTRLLELSREAKIPIIHANDSHYIYPENAKERNILLKSKGITYSDEGSAVLDYPDEDMIYERYKKQGVLSGEQVRVALDNTLIFDECEPVTFINDNIKLPSISDDPIGELKCLLNEQWKKERKKIPEEQWGKYIEAIRLETDIVEKTNMANYFLIDYQIAKDGQEKYGGRLTNTGRGSAPSFYITKLLGLTDIDRLAAPVTLYPTRFMSVERILGTRSLPDIDLNTTDSTPFIKATEDLLGKENCAWMISWKPFKAALAFRTYCKGIGLDISEYDEVAKNLEQYKDDKKWKKIISESEVFIDVIESASFSPCSMLLYDKPVAREVGLVRTKDGMCCLLDGKSCDTYKYLKNDYLTVTVWAIIQEVCNLAGIPIPTIKEINELFDEETFDIYKKGLTSTINQADSEFATDIAKTFCPRSLAEMSAFVAIIRPGCASLLQDFAGRKPYSTGVDELDELLIEGNHRMLYQELIMKCLMWLGIPEAGSYDIIKKISKKKFREQELAELKEKLLKGWKERVGSEQSFIETWTVVEQAASYSFNACVSGDTVLQGTDSSLTIEEMYLIKNSEKYASKVGLLDLHDKYNRDGFGKAYSVFNDGSVRENGIVDIFDSGTRAIFRVTTENGSYLDCTLNHKFHTNCGTRRLKCLKAGDILYTTASEIDGVAVESKIADIKYLRTDKVYDIEMKHPAHNFISKSGLVSMNSHSLAYAYDSLYGAYLKSHYPLEYYTVALNYYSDDQKRTSKLIKELSFFNIELKPIKFRFSKGGYTLSREDRSIYKGIQSVKKLNAAVADELYLLRDNKYAHFVDLIKDVLNKTTLRSDQFKILIQLDFFIEFGDANILLKQYEAYTCFCNLVQIPKSKIEEFGITLDSVRCFALRETPRKFMDVNFSPFIKTVAGSLKAPKRKLTEAVKAQTEYLGYVTIVDPRYKGLAAVVEIDTKYTPRLKLHSLKNGTEVDCKISKRNFNMNKLEKGDVIKIINTEKKPKCRKGKDGKWENIPNTNEMWILTYEKVKNL